jgi:hypothetical protein
MMSNVLSNPVGGIDVVLATRQHLSLLFFSRLAIPGWLQVDVLLMRCGLHGKRRTRYLTRIEEMMRQLSEAVITTVRTRYTLRMSTARELNIAPKPSHQLTRPRRIGEQPFAKEFDSSQLARVSR